MISTYLSHTDRLIYALHCLNSAAKHAFATLFISTEERSLLSNVNFRRSLTEQVIKEG